MPWLLIPFGALGGAILGIVARGWMRWISTDPEFTWAGTLFIVLGFTVFGSLQGLASASRRRGRRRARLTAARVAGVVGMMPLFFAAGGLMAPTVLLGGLAVWRTDWRRWIRGLSAVIAGGPVVVVGTQVAGDFGVLGAVARLIGLVVIYAVIVAATSSAFRPLADG